MTAEQLEGDNEGYVYAKPDATNFEDITQNQVITSSTEYSGEDATTIMSAILTEGVDNVVSRVGSGQVKSGSINSGSAKMFLRFFFTKMLPFVSPRC